MCGESRPDPANAIILQGAGEQAYHQQQGTRPKVLFVCLFVFVRFPRKGLVCRPGAVATAGLSGVPAIAALPPELPGVHCLPGRPSGHHHLQIPPSCITSFVAYVFVVQGGCLTPPPRLLICPKFPPPLSCFHQQRLRQSGPGPRAAETVGPPPHFFWFATLVRMDFLHPLQWWEQNAHMVSIIKKRCHNRSFPTSKATAYYFQGCALCFNNPLYAAHHQMQTLLSVYFMFKSLNIST